MKRWVEIFADEGGVVVQRRESDGWVRTFTNEAAYLMFLSHMVPGGITDIRVVNQLEQEDVALVGSGDVVALAGEAVRRRQITDTFGTLRIR
jgi:hypothetical protein